MVEGQHTNKNGDQLLISVKSPYKNVIEVTGFTYSVIEETEELYYQKDFRWSTDGVLYNDWQPLDNEHLQRLLLDPDKEFWPQYRFTQVGDGSLEFESIALETTTVDGQINEVLMCGVSDNSACCGQQNLVFECCESGFNPYALGNSASIYTQLSRVVSNMFGFCVRYFKTSADQRSKDVILHEYSLLNVIGEGNVKIVIPDNNLPTREINFNPLMMDYPTVFEVHIVKSAFRQVFGQNAKPEVGDYLYFEQYMNKMYEVSAMSETDDYLYTGAYWRVSLAQYQKRSATKFNYEEDELATDTLIFNSDKFNIETLEQEKDVRKPDQYNTIGKLENDYVRRILDKRLHIQMENVYNNWTVISKSHYALKSVEKGNPVVNYRYDKGWTTEDRMLTFWVRPKYEKALRGKVAVIELLEIDGNLAIRTNTPDTNVFPGDIIRLTGTDYPKTVKIIDVVDDVLYTNLMFRDNCVDNAMITPLVTNELMISDGGFDLSIAYNAICVSFNSNDIIFNIDSVDKKVRLDSDKWYGFVLMFKPSESKCGMWIYTLSTGDDRLRNMNSEFDLLYTGMKEDCRDMTIGTGNWSLLSCDMDITSIRLWNQLCEEKLHNLILSQYVVKDSHLCEFVDNAQPELLVDKVTNPR